MPSPKSQIQILVDGLIKAPELAGVPILLSAKRMAKHGQPPRVVIYPTFGKLVNPADRSTSIRDVDRTFVAHIWGADFDQACDLEKRFVQCLGNQAAGGDPLSPLGATPGVFFTADEETWEVSEDSNRQGEEVYVVFTGRAGLTTAAFDKLPQGRGQVNSISYNQATAQLASPMLIGDVVATVGSTAGFPPSGILTIDAEQMQYTAITPTAFAGLIRGVNGTAAAPHLGGVLVNVS